MIYFNTLSLVSHFESCFNMLLNALPRFIGIKFSREEDSLKPPDVFVLLLEQVTTNFVA